MSSWRPGTLLRAARAGALPGKLTCIRFRTCRTQTWRSGTTAAQAAIRPGLKRGADQREPPLMQICRTWEQAAALARPSLHLIVGHSVLVLVLMLGLASHE